MSLPSVQFSATSLAQALIATPTPTVAGGEGGYLKFDGKSGGWSFGRDAESADGEKVLINTASIGHGYVLWVDGVASKVMSRFNEPMPAPMASVDVVVKGRPETKYPAECRVIQGAFMDDKTQLTFETSSYGGRAAVDALLAAIKQKAVSGSQYLFPAVVLSETSYKNKTHNTTIYNPAFEIVSWHDQAGTAEGDVAAIQADEIPEDEQVSGETDAPVRRRRSVAQ